MPKTKNWTRRHKKNNETSWMHDYQPMEVVVEDVRDAPAAEEGENWEAWVNFTDEEFEYNHEDEVDQWIGVFSNRPDAEEEAVD